MNNPIIKKEVAPATWIVQFRSFPSEIEAVETLKAIQLMIERYPKQSRRGSGTPKI